ncbi:hypothetical protein BDF22DRAFT_743972 [Syncephalis plumigaleata]|nr:hypothetical protein BDF22DRAFT_743972 [Syncephalis plumigaleata]
MLAISHQVLLSELLKKLIEQAMSPDTSPEAIAACQHVISQLKAVIYTFMIQERTSFAQSIFDDWDPISFWRLIHRILVTDDNEENGIPKTMLLKMIVMMMECAIYLNYEATAHALIGQSSAMERRHHSTLWLDWLPLVLEVDDIDLTLLDTCQELIHKLILFVYIECISPASMIKQLHNILRKLPIDRVYLFVESLKSPTFRCMYLNFFFHNCCSFSDTTASSHRYLADRPLDLLKITRLFFTSKALSHTSTWLSSEYTLRLLSLLLSSYMTSRGCARSPGIRSYSDTPWLVHGFSKMN